MGTGIDQQRLKLLIDGFLKGDSTQFRIIQTKIIQYINHQHFGTDVDRDELVSEVIEALFDNLRKGKFRGDSLSALNVYIYSIIRHRICRVLRSRARLTYVDNPGDERPDGRSSPEAVASAKDLVSKIFRLIDEGCRELLNLKFQECWSDQEIADHLHKSKNATSTAISRCLKKAQQLEIVKQIV